jgi:RNA polymerase sigma-70 factor (ECF subfamily)
MPGRGFDEMKVGGLAQDAPKSADAYLEAFQNIFEENKTLIYSLSFRLLGNRQEAENLTQEVFLNAFRAYPHFRGESKVSTWLCRIAINLINKELRGKKLKKFLSLDFLSEESGRTPTIEPTHPRHGPAAELEKKEMERIVQRLIRSLPERQRTAITLQYYEGLAYEEIASAMEISRSSAESLLFRAKQNLEKRLAPYLIDS